MSAQPQPYLTREQVARRLSKSVATVDRLIRDGKLRSIRPEGTTWRLIPADAVDEFVYGRRIAEVHDLNERRGK